MLIEKQGFRISKITEYLPTNLNEDFRIEIITLDPNLKPFRVSFNVTQEFLAYTGFEIKYQVYWDLIMDNYQKLLKEKLKLHEIL